MDSVLSFVPSEDRVAYSAMTGQSLFYMGEKDLKHKVLAVAEEHGAERASYALKLLQSDGELSIASTGKDPHSGRLVTHEYRVEGPAAIFLTTTAIEIDEELLNRCLVLTVDEDREQTRAIHRRQREAQTLEGLLAKHESDEILATHRNAQRLLRPLEVVNPFARKLTFLDDRTRMRRDHLKYLGLIRAIALLFQHQRPKKTAMRHGKPIEYVEVTLDDLAIANRLANEVLGRSLDELPPQTRKLLSLLEQAVSAECERSKIERSALLFSTRDVRRWAGWGQTQVKVHLARLVELEYVLVHRGGRGQSFVYELLYAGEGQDGERFLPGLLDVEALASSFHYDTNRSASETRWSGQNAEWSGVGRPRIGGWSGGGRTPSNGSGAKQDAGLILFAEENPSETLLGREEKKAVVSTDGSRTAVFPLVASLSPESPAPAPR